MPPILPPGGTITLLEPLGGNTGFATLPLGATIVLTPLEGVIPTTGTLAPGATMLETSPDAGSTGVKLEGIVMLEALSGMMLGGRTELGGSRLIWDENASGSLETGLVLGAGCAGLLEVAVVVAPEILKACTPTLGALTD